MSLWKIAWRSIQQRGVASLLTSLSMALGVMLVVSVLSIHGVIAQSFRSNTNLGYNMIIGAKGGKLQLTLNSVFYLSQPIENIPFDYYLEFLDAAHRSAAYQHSLQNDLHKLVWQSRATQWQVAAGAHSAGALVPAGIACLEKACEATLQQCDYTWMFKHAGRAVAPLEAGRPGRFSRFTKLAIPLCLGDYFGRFRVIGTTPDFFDRLTFGEEGERAYQFAQGRNFQQHGEKYGYFEAVVGATVAREMQLNLDSKINPAHGDPERGGHVHAQAFHVVGILKPTGTPNDRGVFVNIEGFYLMQGHAKPVEQTGAVVTTGVEEIHEHEHEHDHAHHHPLPVEQREVTAILVKTVNHRVTSELQTQINEGAVAQAVFPVLQIYGLFDTFVKPIERVLLALTAMICIVSGVSILVSIYNSMSDRRHEIGIMRALGASRNTVMTVILLESVLLSLGGGALGWTLGHTVNALASTRIEQQTGVSMGFFSLAPPVKIAEVLGADPTMSWVQNLRISSELMLVPALIMLAIAVGFFPALTAYRTDVAQALDR